MPYASARLCPKPGCHELIRGKHRYCVEHGRAVEREKPKRLRGEAGMRRRELFMQQYPLCVGCMKEGRVTAGEEVDHIIPLAKGGPDSWGNLQMLCADCHSKKTADDFGYAPKLGCDEDGIPLARRKETTNS